MRGKYAPAEERHEDYIRNNYNPLPFPEGTGVDVGNYDTLDLNMSLSANGATARINMDFIIDGEGFQ